MDDKPESLQKSHDPGTLDKMLLASELADFQSHNKEIQRALLCWTDKLKNVKKTLKVEQDLSAQHLNVMAGDIETLQKNNEKLREEIKTLEGRESALKSKNMSLEERIRQYQEDEALIKRLHCNIQENGFNQENNVTCLNETTEILKDNLNQQDLDWARLHVDKTQPAQKDSEIMTLTKENCFLYQQLQQAQKNEAALEMENRLLKDELKIPVGERKARVCLPTVAKNGLDIEQEQENRARQEIPARMEIAKVQEFIEELTKSHYYHLKTVDLLAEIGKLNAKIIELKSKQAHCNFNHIDKTELKPAESTQVISENNGHLEKLQERLDHLDKVNDKLLAELNQSRDFNRQMTENYDKKLQEALAEKCLEICSLQRVVAGRNLNIESLKKQMESEKEQFLAEKADILSKLQDVEMALLMEKAVTENLQTENDSLRSHIDTLIHENNTISYRLFKMEEVLSDFQNENNQLSAELENATSLNRFSFSEREELLEKHQMEKSRMEQSLRVCQDENNQLSEELENAKFLNRFAFNEIEELLEKHQMEKSRMEQSLRVCQDKNNQLKLETENLKSENIFALRQLGDMLEKHQREKSIMEQVLTAWQDEKTQLISEIERLKAKNHDAVQEKEEMKEKYRNEIRKIISEYDDFSEKWRACQNECNQLRLDYETVNDNFCTAVREKDAIERKYTNENLWLVKSKDRLAISKQDTEEIWRQEKSRNDFLEKENAQLKLHIAKTREEIKAKRVEELDNERRKNRSWWQRLRRRRHIDINL